VSLFTDGQPVVSWNDEEERCFKVVDAWKDRVIALNTVGYGNYYNQEFMKELAGKTMFGQLVHSSQINEYMDIFSRNYERVSELVMDKVELSSPNSEILYLNSKSSKFAPDSMVMRMLEKKKNQFVVVADSSEPDVHLNLNGTSYKVDDITTVVPKDTLRTVLYGYAYEHYYKGNRQYALDILAKTLKDKFLVDSQFQAFTFDEVSEHTKRFNKAVFSTKGRLLDGECDESYLPKEDAPCVMDILRLLTTGDNSYIYRSGYQRTGLKTADTFNLFERNDGDIRTPLHELVFNKERLNISLRSKISGKVKLNPVQADKVGLPREVESYMYRNQTVVKDGYLNMDTIKVIVDEQTLNALTEIDKEVGGKLLASVEAVPESPKHSKVMLDLITLPIVNRLYTVSKGTSEEVLSDTFRLVELEAQQKVANYYAKMVKSTKLVEDGFDTKTGYTVEQLDLLKEHGLDSYLQYIGVENKTADKNDADFYEAKVFEFQVKGMASLPSMNDVIKKIKGSDKLNQAGVLMKDYIMSLQQKINSNLSEESAPVGLLDDTITFLGAEEFFENEQKRIKRELQDIRIELASMKIGKVITGGWFDNLVSDGKGAYNYIKDNVTLVVKPEKVRVYFTAE
jgi:hypothetical protein